MTAEAPETIVIFAANPDDRHPLGLDREVREIENAVRQSRKPFDVRPKLATRAEDLRRALLDYNPAYVHFCGHGEGEPGIVLDGHVVGGDALADLFKLFSDRIKCVVLNACYSSVQAQAIVRHIDYVIGMNEEIGDEAAIQFASAFYDALGAGKPVPFAFALGCNAIQVVGLSEHRTPELLVRPRPASTGEVRPPAQVHTSRRDWDGAPSVSLLYGRERAAEILRSWILDDSCRVVLITGLGGIGKSDLAACLGRGGNTSTGTSATLAEGIHGHFDVVLWRSLLNAPPPDDLLADILDVLSDHTHAADVSAERRLEEILRFLQGRRCLVILDNVEALLRPGDPTMGYREGYEPYGSFFELIGRAQHRSCLLLTSREKPRPISDLEGVRKPVRSLALAGLGPADSQSIFAQIGTFDGRAEHWEEVVKLYGGNPLALELVARHVEQVFDGDLSAFLHGGRSVFADLEEVLNWHLDRLPERETELVNWFAIEREPVTRETLEGALLSPASRDRLTSTLQSLQRRLPLERVIAHHFTLQPVLIEHVTARLVQRLSELFDTAIEPSSVRRSGRVAAPHAARALLRALNTHALAKATVRENVREAQQRLIVAPIAEQLSRSLDRSELRALLADLIELWRTEQAGEPGYAIGNLLHLMSHLKIDLHALDLSRLHVWQACLQDVNLHATDFSFSNFRDTTFRHAFGAAFSLAYSPDGRLIAVGDDDGEIRVFSAASGQLHLRCAEHGDAVSAVTFSADGEWMASASYDNTIRLWSTADGRCLDVLLGHRGWVYSLAIAPDRRTLASASEDGTCRLWDLTSGTWQVLPTDDQAFLAAVAFSPNGEQLAVAGSAGVVHLFRVSDLEHPARLSGHTGRIRSLAFSRQGDLLASGAEDQQILVWRPSDGRCLGRLSGHSGDVMSLSFSAVGDVLASGSNDHTVRLWSSRRQECIGQLQASASRIWAVACSPTSRTVAAASDDSTIRIWNIDTRQRLSTLRGYSNKTWSLTFSVHGHLVAGNDDSLVRVWDVQDGRTSMELRGHISRVWAVACSPDGRWIASASDDQSVRIWDLRTGALQHILRGHKDWIRSVAFSPDGHVVASAAEDGRVMIWDAEHGGLRISIDSRLPRAFAVTFCGDSNTIAAGGAGRDVELFSSNDGAHLGTLRGHEGWMTAVIPVRAGALASCSEDGTIRLWNLAARQCRSVHAIGHKIWCGAPALGGQALLTGSEDGTLRRWDVDSSLYREIRAHQGSIWSLAVDDPHNIVATAGDDGSIRLWQLRDLAPCAAPNILRAPRPYEGMNISGATGLTIEQRNALTALGAIEMPSA